MKYLLKKRGEHMDKLNLQRFNEDDGTTLFDSIKHINEYGQEFWYTRELSKVLNYKDFRNFEAIIYKAMEACQNSGYNISDHFGEITEMVHIGSSAKRSFPSYILSRYACYLIVMNGNPNKEVIALGQTYFAIKTRQQEIIDNYDNLTESKKILDHMGSTELTANLFRSLEHSVKCRVLFLYLNFIKFTKEMINNGILYVFA